MIASGVNLRLTNARLCAPFRRRKNNINIYILVLYFVLMTGLREVLEDTL